jgi:membrane protease YdiL (CAAX protease family)
LEGPLKPRDRFSPLEFALVIGVAFGYSIYLSVGDLLSGNVVGTAGAGDVFGDESMYRLVVWELLLAGPVAGILYLGGWRLRDFSLGISLKTSLIGASICVGYLVAHEVFTFVMMQIPALLPLIDVSTSYAPAAPPSLMAIVLVSTVNPVFEEVFAGAYVIKTLHRRFGLTAAIWVSVAIRAAYHLYQGIPSLPTHVAYGLALGLVYARYGRLWPLILSHALLDAFATALLIE